jgi:hypothetical protein
MPKSVTRKQQAKLNEQAQRELNNGLGRGTAEQRQANIKYKKLESLREGEPMQELSTNFYRGPTRKFFKIPLGIGF